MTWIMLDKNRGLCVTVHPKANLLHSTTASDCQTYSGHIPGDKPEQEQMAIERKNLRKGWF